MSHMPIVTASEMQQMDRTTIESFGLPGRVLMENAGRGVVDVMVGTFPEIRSRRIGIVAGKGNNGGDGFVIARYLSAMGASVSVYLCSERSAVKGDAAANLLLLDALNVPIIEVTTPSFLIQHSAAMQDQEIWVDALLGTGLNSEVHGLFLAVIEWVNSLDRPVVSVDIPSGLHADTGLPCGACIRAHTTVTFGFAKIGHLLFPGAQFTGRLEVVDIGIPPHIASGIGIRHHVLRTEGIAASLPVRPATGHKGTAGHVLVVGGSTGKAGAAAMSGMGALRSGAGLVTLAVPGSLNPIIQSLIPEIMTAPMAGRKEGCWDDSLCEDIAELLQGKKCLAMGPGMGDTEESRPFVMNVLRNASVPVVLDADGLNCVSGRLEVLKSLKAPAILTPHPGEMSRLTGVSVGDIQSDRIGIARRFSRTHGVHLVLKGARTVIAHPDGTVYINRTANPGMATGGMGDVLTGIIAGLVAQGMSPETASHAGVFLHGKAADALTLSRGPVGFLASEVAGMLPQVIWEIREAEG